MKLMFGKYKGLDLSQVSDKGYLEWLVKNFAVGSPVQVEAQAELNRRNGVTTTHISTSKKQSRKNLTLISHVMRGSLRKI